MKTLTRILFVIFIIFPSIVYSQTVSPLTVKDGNGTNQTLCQYKADGTNLEGCVSGPTPAGNAAASPPVIIGGTANAAANGTIQNLKVDSSGNAYTVSPLSPTIGNATSTLSLTSATTAYTVNQLIANNSSGTSLTVPSFTLTNPQGTNVSSVEISRIRLSINDATSTSWGNQEIQIDFWSAAPTFLVGSGDRSTFSPATGTGSHLASFMCSVSSVYGDGEYAECSSNNATPDIKLASGSTIYWTATAITGSGVTGASKTMTLTAEIKY